ncbi:MAG: PCRF domain-containing protein, partial [Desulfarculaceae bacterium]|nr:PCRF domain-containing protein [Desulfarculaceae bacterium]
MAELDKLMAKDGFWDDQEAAKEVMQERSGLTETLESLDALTGQAEDAEVMLELSQEEQDKAAAKEAESGLKELERG